MTRATTSATANTVYISSENMMHDYVLQYISPAEHSLSPLRYNFTQYGRAEPENRLRASGKTSERLCGTLEGPKMIEY